MALDHVKVVDLIEVWDREWLLNLVCCGSGILQDNTRWFFVKILFRFNSISFSGKLLH